MNTKELAVVLLFASAGLLTTSIAFAVLWVSARERALRARLEPLLRSDASVRSNDRIEHLVNAVESIAIEVERISEAQRFTAQVLGQRVSPLGDASRMDASRLPEHVITPH